MFASGKRLIQQAVETFCKDQEEADPRIKKAEIKGSTPHKSHDDPGDTQDVISVRFKDDSDSRLGTGHVHEDGSGKVKWKK